MPLPYLTADLPGTGGVLRASPSDFEVEELPAYAPSGDGDHVFTWIEKTDLTTFAAVRALARNLGVAERDVGTAGLKDRRAVTRQWLSFPPPVTPEQALAAAAPGVRVLAAHRHRHKLRTGHLTGNRFAITLRQLALPAADAAARATAVLARLAEPPGCPNYYGEQRFGHDNVALARRLLAGERVPGGPRERRLYVSALQSELFNRVLAARLTDGLWRRVLAGDVMARVASGGPFVSTEPAVDEPRVAAGEVVVTGPMFGPEMRAPAPGSEPAEREAQVLAAAGVGPADLERVAKLAPGTRRPLAVRATAAGAEALGDALRVELTLPAGSYATVFLREITKSDAALAAEE